MRKLLSVVALGIALALPAAHAYADDDANKTEGLIPVVASAAVAGVANVSWMYAAAGGTGLMYLIANQVDPWHPLACALFGKDARVGNETTAHCN